MNTCKTLEAAKALIADPKCWIKGVIALNDDGEQVESDNLKAVCFCSLGALRAAAANRGINKALRTLYKHLPENYNGFLTGWNDHSSTTHEDVMKLFDKAIQDAKNDIRN